MKGVSVIICCHNSASRILTTLKHLSIQDLSASIPWEIILVDNNSDDKTSEVALKYWGSINTSIQMNVVVEKKIGLSTARITGSKSSKYDYLVFCDDDNWLNCDYLSKAFFLLETKSEYGVFGGQSIAVTDTGIIFPDWFEFEKNSYAVGKQLRHSGDATSRKYLWGSGIIIRKKIFGYIFLKNDSLLSGRTGKNLSSGEDAEICSRVILLGFLLYYDEQLFFKHYISPNRLTQSYRDNLYKGHISALAILEKYWNYIDHCKISFTEKYYLGFMNLIRFLKKILLVQTIDTNILLNIYLCCNMVKKTKDITYIAIHGIAIDLKKNDGL